MTAEMTEPAAAYRRVLLKLSGEALLGEQSFGIDVKVARSVAEEIKQAHELGTQIAVVVGGGNIFRGVSASAGNMDRASADYIGMLATVMNAVVLQDALEKIGIHTRVLSAIDIPQLAEPFIRRRMNGSASCGISIAESTRVCTSIFSSASCRTTAFMTVASMPM